MDDFEAFEENRIEVPSGTGWTSIDGSIKIENKTETKLTIYMFLDKQENIHND